jgi:hypothetical protein
MRKVKFPPKSFPNILIASFDPLVHKTIDDLVELARHELDLFKEGEESDIVDNSDVIEVVDFIALTSIQKSTKKAGSER